MSPACLSFSCIKVAGLQAELSWRRFVLEKLIVAHLFKKFTSFNGTLVFIAMFR
jgi:hypothetical protein